MTPQILVCDDEPHVIRAISLKLSRADFDVKGVLDLESCSRWLEQHDVPALLIIDDSLPSTIATADFLKRLRRQSRFASLSVIRLIANHDNDTIELSEFDEVMAKPFSSHELLESVCGMLGCETGMSVATVRTRRELATV